MNYEDELRTELQVKLTRYARNQDPYRLLICLSTLDPEFEALWVEAIAGWALSASNAELSWIGHWMIQLRYGWHLYTRAIALLQRESAYLRRLAG